MDGFRNKRLRALIFDVDGTLADTEELHRQAFNRAFREFGLDWYWSPTMYEKLLSISGGLERIRYFGRDLASQFSDDTAFRVYAARIQQVKTSIYDSLLVNNMVQLRPGVRRLLDAAREANIKLAIATSTARSNVKTLLDRNLPAGWSNWFAAIETSDTVVEKKPSPAVYRAALSATGFTADECIAIEDTVNGLRAARNAGIVTIITTHYFTRRAHFPDARLVVDQLGEPNHPCQVLAGGDLPKGHVDLSVLNDLLAASPGLPGPDWRMPPHTPLRAMV
ncbi:MAG: HAD-IA family hydrolase [Gammaproteobacteria bacterium]|nr:HAD-IA family hydrolase [Gammaproteobacteria bacterium]